MGVFILTISIIAVCIIAINIVYGKREKPIPRYKDETFSYHERGIATKPKNYPTQPKILITIYPN